MTFKGTLCFENAAKRAEAHRLIASAAPAVVIGPGSVDAKHLALSFDVERTAPATSWHATLSLLYQLADTAWCGFVSCDFGDDEQVVVRPELRDSRGWWKRLRGKLNVPMRTSTPRFQREQRHTTEANPSGLASENFRVLVFYAVPSEDDEVTSRRASFVFGGDAGHAPCSVDRAPHPSLYGVHELAYDTNVALDDDTLDREQRDELLQLLAWVQASQMPWFAAQREPLLIAGGGAAQVGSERTFHQQSPPSRDRWLPCDEDPDRLFRVQESAGAPRHMVIHTLRQRDPLDSLRADLELPSRWFAPITYFGPSSSGAMLVFEEPAGRPSARFVDETGPWPEDVACALALHVGHAISEVHADGRHLHAGLHPELTWIDDSSGAPCVTGLAPYLSAVLVNEDKERVMDDRGPLFGGRHLGLLSSEAAKGVAPGAPTDVFALCAMLNYWVTGSGLYAGESMIEQLTASLTGNRMPSSVSVALQSVLELGLAPDPGERCGIDKLIEQLEALVG